MDNWRIGEFDFWCHEQGTDHPFWAQNFQIVFFFSGTLLSLVYYSKNKYFCYLYKWADFSDVVIDSDSEWALWFCFLIKSKPMKISKPRIFVFRKDPTSKSSFQVNMLGRNLTMSLKFWSPLVFSQKIRSLFNSEFVLNVFEDEIMSSANNFRSFDKN